jgi:hypothetical protein
MTYEEAGRQALGHPRFRAVASKLLSFGGDQVVPQLDPYFVPNSEMNESYLRDG